MFEHVKTVVDGVYKWTVNDGNVEGKGILIKVSYEPVEVE